MDLPQPSATNQARTTSSTPRPGPSSAWTPVFVVDDDACLRELVGDWVEDAGFRPLLFPDGAACLAALAIHRPSAVILDLHMSGLSGAETLDLIRTVDHEVPVIALTGDADPVAVLDLIERGADEFLLKPVSRTRLVRSLLATALRDAALVPA